MDGLSLHALHLSHGAVFGSVGGREVVRHYGATVNEDEARKSAALLDLSFRDQLEVVGEDRVTFLHGMVTNDVNGLQVGKATYAAMLTAKGAMVGDARLWKLDSAVLLDTEPGLGAKVKEFLEKYLISEDAEVRDVTSGFGMLGVYGPEHLKVLAATFGSFAALGQDEVRALTFEEHPVLAVGASQVLPGVELRVPTAALEKLWERLAAVGARPVGFDTFELWRVEAGVPRYGADMDDKTIPLEANLERALHYNKGCYIGQEVIARATFRGHMNRKLVGLLLGETVPEAHAELRAGDKKVGWVTSVVRSPRAGQQIALGYVHRDHLQPGTELTVATGGTAKVSALPFVHDRL